MLRTCNIRYCSKLCGNYLTCTDQKPPERNVDFDWLVNFANMFQFDHYLSGVRDTPVNIDYGFRLVIQLDTMAVLIR